MTTDDRLSDERVDTLTREVFYDPSVQNYMPTLAARLAREVKASRATLAAIEAHVTACLANYLGQDDPYEDGYADACDKVLALLHPNPEEDPT